MSGWLVSFAQVQPCQIRVGKRTGEDKLKRFGMQQLISLGFGLLLIVTGLIGTLGVTTSLGVQRMNRQAELDSQRALLAEHLVMLQQRQQATSRAFFLQPSADARKRFDEATRDFQATYSKLAQMTGDEQGRELLEDAGSACDAGNAVLADMFRLEENGHHADVLDKLTRSVSVSKRIRDSLDKFRNYAQGQADELAREQQRSTTRAIWLSSIAPILGILLAMVCGTVIVRVVGARVRQAQGAIDAVANRDLSGPAIEVHTHDPLGQALVALNRMKDGLSYVVRDMRLIAVQVASASVELAATAQNSAENSHTQRSQAELFATAVHEMATVVEQIAGNASAVSRAANGAAEFARQGDEAVAASVAKMEQIAAGSTAVAQSIEALAEHSQRIGQAANLIREIAEQTNLLALNASIEAARAGEQGKGFAVVASEVRRLAERTAAATAEIDGMVVAVTRQTSMTLEKTRMEQGCVNEGVALASATRQSLVHIRSSVGSVESMTAQIAAATTEQSSATQELQQTLKQIMEMVSASDVAAVDTSNACKELSQLSEHMRRALSEFVLSSADEAGGEVVPRHERTGDRRAAA
jgi:methyl-accepting chemotaxis protein